MTDLATILFILVVVSGIIWAYDKWWLAPRRLTLAASAEGSDGNSENAVPVWIDLARSLFPVFLIVFMLRSFVVEPFRIPSGSMMPSLLIGDFILVNKYDYGIRLPIINAKILELGKPKHGDVVVFRYPEDPKIPFIKRIVGLPGDHVMYNSVNKTLYINNQPVKQELTGIYQGNGSGKMMTGAQEGIEFIPGQEHAILIRQDQISRGPHEEMVVPEDHYFVLGDNRDNSRDSRYWGTVPDENLIGRAFLVWMNFDWGDKSIDWSRIGTKITK
jgi:signal peptidase I